MSKFRTFPVVALAVVSVSLSAQAPPPISFTVEGPSVTATGLSPGGAAAVLNVSLESAGSSSIVTRTWRDARAGADGAISVSFTDPIAAGALIAVIDIETGRIARTTGTDTVFEQETFPANRLKRNAGADVDEVSSPNASALLVVVRPGVGAWLRVAHDGGKGDADGRVDGRITTDPAALRPIAYSPEAPKKIRPRDIVLVADPGCLCFAMLEVAP